VYSKSGIIRPWNDSGLLQADSAVIHNRIKAIANGKDNVQFSLIDNNHQTKKKQQKNYFFKGFFKKKSPFFVESFRRLDPIEGY